MTYESIISEGKTILSGEVNLTVAKTSTKGRTKKKQVKKATTASVCPNKKKMKKPRDLSKVKCFYCQKKGHYKTDCAEYKAYRLSRGNKELLVLEANLVEDSSNLWVIDSGATKSCLFF